MSNYSELLKDPRWQKKRLKIMERDDWMCKGCGSKTETLHVHHLNYIWGGKPWEAEDDDLVTLCEDCHKMEEGLKEYHLINEVAKSAKIPNIKLWLLVSAIGYLKVTNKPALDEITALITKHTFDFNKKDFNAFIGNPSKYVRGKSNAK